MTSPQKTLYLFCTYPHLKTKIITFAHSLNIRVEDGFHQQSFDPSSVALLDEGVSEKIYHKLAKELSIIYVSDTKKHPLALLNLNPQFSFQEFKAIFDPRSSTYDSAELEVYLPGVSEKWQDVHKFVQLAASHDCPVLIRGESGTGKELVARSIHQLSCRSKSPFIAVNCGAIPSELVESELFGHEKGSFTGAIATRAGKFEQVGQGSLFLDEIGDMPLAMQVKLLRALQEKYFEKIGSNKLLKFEGRLISATHHDLSLQVTQKTFREDLFYRLNVLPIYLPPLRERIDDIPYIINALIKREKLQIQLSSSAHEALVQYYWPGNVRQLFNLLFRAEVFYKNTSLQKEHILSLLQYEPQCDAHEIKYA